MTRYRLFVPEYNEPAYKRDIRFQSREYAIDRAQRHSRLHDIIVHVRNDDNETVDVIDER